MVVVHTIWLSLVAMTIWTLLMTNGPSVGAMIVRSNHFGYAEALIGFRLFVVTSVTGFMIAVVLLRVLDVGVDARSTAQWTFTLLSLGFVAMALFMVEWDMAPTVTAPLGPVGAWLGVTSGWSVAACA